jgi:hypothetical protein
MLQRQLSELLFTIVRARAARIGHRETVGDDVLLCASVFARPGTAAEHIRE